MAGVSPALPLAVERSAAVESASFEKMRTELKGVTGTCFACNLAAKTYPV